MCGPQGPADGLDLVEAGRKEEAFGVVAEDGAGGLEEVQNAEGDGDDVLGSGAGLHPVGVQGGIDQEALRGQEIPNHDGVLGICAGRYEAGHLALGHLLSVRGPGDVHEIASIETGQVVLEDIGDEAETLRRLQEALGQDGNDGLPLHDGRQGDEALDRVHQEEGGDGQDDELAPVHCLADVRAGLDAGREAYARQVEGIDPVLADALGDLFLEGPHRNIEALVRQDLGYGRAPGPGAHDADAAFHGCEDSRFPSE